MYGFIPHDKKDTVSPMERLTNIMCIGTEKMPQDYAECIEKCTRTNLRYFSSDIAELILYWICLVHDFMLKKYR